MINLLVTFKNNTSKYLTWIKAKKKNIIKTFIMNKKLKLTNIET